MNSATLEKLKAIGQLMMTQDNRCTASPMFCVQVCERDAMPDGHSDDHAYYDAEECAVAYPDRHIEEWKAYSEQYENGDLPDHVTRFCFRNRWNTVAACFTEAGCQEHLRQNGHNYRHFYGTRIYAESFYRNPEMNTIRDALMELAKEECTVTP